MKHLLSIAVLAVAIWLSAWPVVADQFLDGQAAYDSGDYATALRLWQPMADQGDPLVQGKLGDIYYNGLGVPRDYAVALNWYRLAAVQGDANAQYNLGLMYENGQGISKDFALAIDWYHRAANQDQANAQYKLGTMYQNGTGVPPDYIQAYKWFTLSILSGNSQGTKDLEIVAAKMTPEQIAESQKLATEWRQKTWEERTLQSPE